jgi:hypothetical protein
VKDADALQLIRFENTVEFRTRFEVQKLILKNFPQSRAGAMFGRFQSTS